MKKHYFIGHYYKFITKDSKFSFAFILSVQNKKPTRQLILRDASYTLSDEAILKVVDDKTVFINIEEQGLSMNGILKLGDYHKPKHNIMSFFALFKMECKHSIRSLYHSVSGSLTLNDKEISFEKGRGYIEGDEGYSFPSEYLWYNSLSDDYTVTLAIARVPFMFSSFLGLLCVIRIGDKEYNLSTYKGGKIKIINRRHVLISKGKYHLMVNYSVDQPTPPLLLAPTNAGMDRMIKENLVIPSSFTFVKGREIILERADKASSLEYMFEEDFYNE